MSLNDPIVVTFFPGYEKWGLIQGRETFYDDNRKVRLWGTAQEAYSWAKDHYPYNQVVGAGESLPKA